MTEHRHVGSTNFNLLSSRSHTIFTLVFFFFTLSQWKHSVALIYCCISVAVSYSHSNLFSWRFMLRLLFSHFLDIYGQIDKRTSTNTHTCTPPTGIHLLACRNAEMIIFINVNMSIMYMGDYLTGPQMMQLVNSILN